MEKLSGLLQIIHLPVLFQSSLSYRFIEKHEAMYSLEVPLLSRIGK